MELIDAALIERIRKALIKRYDRDQKIQQMIEEIGAEEGLNESELAIIYQAYLEVKERVYYTSTLVDLWNQIDEVQRRMSLLHTYESLEQDLFGTIVATDDSSVAYGLGKGATHSQDDYVMEQVQLAEVPLHHDPTVGINHVKLNELKTMGGLFTGAGENSVLDESDDFDESSIEHMTINPLDGVESLEIHHLDEGNDKNESNDNDTSKTHIDPLTAVNALLFGKGILSDDKANKKLEKLIKKQLDRVDEEWARINGTSKHGKDDKTDKKHKKDKKDKHHKHDKKDKHDKHDKHDKKDKDAKTLDTYVQKEEKKAKKDKELKKLEKALYKVAKKSKKDKEKEKNKDGNKSGKKQKR